MSRSLRRPSGFIGRVSVTKRRKLKLSVDFKTSAFNAPTRPNTLRATALSWKTLKRWSAKPETPVSSKISFVFPSDFPSPSFSRFFLPFSRHRSTRSDLRATKIINQVTSVLVSLRRRTNTTYRSMRRTTVLPVVPFLRATRLSIMVQRTLELRVFRQAATNLRPSRMEERAASPKVSEEILEGAVAIKPFPNRLNSKISVSNEHFSKSIINS